MKFTKKTVYIGLFAVLYLIVAFSSFFHACAFFGLANNSWMSIILAFAFEVGQAAVLFSLLTSSKDRNRIMPWVLMTMFTLVQVIGNVYSSYKYIIINSVENLRYFKEPIFIWTDLPDAQANVIIVYLVGALLPIAALLLTSMITNYLTDQSEDENSNKFLNNDLTSENPLEDSLINQHSILQMEKQGLEELNKKKEEEIEQLKKQLEDAKKTEIKESETKSETSTEEDKLRDSGERPIETEEETTTSESPESTDDGLHSKTVEDNIGESDESETKLDEDKSENGRNNEEHKQIKPSHFINL